MPSDKEFHCENHDLRICNLEHDMKGVKHNLYGVDGKMGLTTMVSIIWRAHVIWPMMAIGALLGSGLTLLISSILKPL